MTASSSKSAVPRIRFIKPEFFDDPDIGELTPMARLFFIGLWTQADREGRLINDPRRLKARIFPYDAVEIPVLAVELHGKKLIVLYDAPDPSTGLDRPYIWIRNFQKHQRPHPKEPASVIPPAVEKRGKTRKNTADPVDSGFLILDSGDQKQKIRAVPAARHSRPVKEKHPRTPDENIRVITRIAHEVMSQNGRKTDADAAEQVKTLCAQRHIAYNSEVVRKALESAEVQSA